MRTMILLYCCVLMSVLMVGIVSSLTMRSSYAETIRDSLDDSIVYSVKMLQRDRDAISWVESSDGAETTTTDLQRGDFSFGDNWGEVAYGNPEEVLKSPEKFKADFVRYLTYYIDQKVSKINVKIYGVDTRVGALSVEVVAEFKYPSGQTGTVSSYKTVILNKWNTSGELVSSAGD